MMAVEKVEKAKQVDIQDFLDKNSIGYKQEGNYLRLEDHDSFLIHLPTQGFSWNSENKQGFGAVKFASVYYGIPYAEAAEMVNSGDYKQAVHREPIKKEFQYDQQDEIKDTTQMYRYLCDVRGIDRELVRKVYEQGILQPMKRNWIAAKWMKEGKLVGCTKQGTWQPKDGGRSPKFIYPNQEPFGGVTIDFGKPNKLIICENFVDGLSHATLQPEVYQNARMIALDGASTKLKTVFRAAYQMRKEGLPIYEFNIAADNDKAGLQLVESVLNYVDESMVKPMLPKSEEGEDTDWNEELKKARKDGREIPKANWDHVSSPGGQMVVPIPDNQKLVRLPEAITRKEPSLSRSSQSKPAAKPPAEEGKEQDNPLENQKDLFEDLKVREKFNGIVQKRNKNPYQRSNYTRTKRTDTRKEKNISDDPEKVAKDDNKDREYIDLVKESILRPVFNQKNTVKLSAEMTRSIILEEQEKEERRHQLERLYTPDKLYELRMTAVSELKQLPLDEKMKAAVTKYEHKVSIEYKLRHGMGTKGITR
ncbi:toprim domain-containing protein [Listeria monocytogenes]|nr:toprim domain-containing protein [Listeria monocytogenes]